MNEKLEKLQSKNDNGFWVKGDFGTGKIGIVYKNNLRAIFWMGKKSRSMIEVGTVDINTGELVNLSSDNDNNETARQILAAL